MILRLKKIRKGLFIASAILLPTLVFAQPDEDSVRYLSDDLQKVQLDTTYEEPPPEITIEDGDSGYVTFDGSKYFLQKGQQWSQDSLQSGKLPDSVLGRIKQDGDFWYVNEVFEKEKKEKKDLQETEGGNISFFQGTFFQTLLWLAIIGGFATFVIIYLSNSNVGLFRKKTKVISAADEEMIETDNIFEIRYDSEIDKAVGKGNYRLAVRLMFLRLLKELSNKNVIQYKPERTNFDYLMQLYSTKHYNDFFRLTRNYEYSWYGQFDIDKEKFYLIRNDFENFNNRLRI